MAGLANSAPLRKGLALVRKVPRALTRIAARDADWQRQPPIIVNALPKSGTHLLMQIAERIPGTRQYGSFLAQTPSLTLRLRSQTEIDRRIAAIVPGEIVGAHLYHTPATQAALSRINALHLFIWRDPRDVLLSEAHYLAEMSRWHAMHRSFAALPDGEARVRLAIEGQGDRYPGAETRIGAYMGWTTSPDTLALRYEDLSSGTHQLAACQRILDAYAARATAEVRLPTAQALVAAIDPGRSHTFNRGGIARWKTEMSAANQALCRERLGPWLDA